MMPEWVQWALIAAQLGSIVISSAWVACTKRCHQNELNHVAEMLEEAYQDRHVYAERARAAESQLDFLAAERDRLQNIVNYFKTTEGLREPEDV